MFFVPCCFFEDNLFTRAEAIFIYRHDKKKEIISVGGSWSSMTRVDVQRRKLEVFSRGSPDTESNEIKKGLSENLKNSLRP